MEVLDKLADLQRTLVVSQGDRVNSKTGKLFDEGNQGLEVFFDADVEGISILEIDRDCILSAEALHRL